LDISQFSESLSWREDRRIGRVVVHEDTDARSMAILMSAMIPVLARTALSSPFPPVVRPDAT